MRTKVILVALAALVAGMVTSGCESKANYEMAIETSPIGVVVTNMDGDILQVNTAYLNMVGYDMSELKSKTYQDLTPSKWHEMEKKAVEHAMKEGFVRFEKEYIKKDGTIVPIEVTGWIVRDANSGAIGTASYVIDRSPRTHRPVHRSTEAPKPKPDDKE